MSHQPGQEGAAILVHAAASAPSGVCFLRLCHLRGGERTADDQRSKRVRGLAAGFQVGLNVLLDRGGRVDRLVAVIQISMPSTRLLYGAF